ncbi:MAG: MerR family transcriptional regulator [Saprospiraceae bacterium]|nr:MerR family transcriptional regulator [Saprospiraceae bacterium]
MTENALLKSEKLYFSISEIAESFGVSTSLIRYWETEFSFLKPHKNSKGDRRFTKQNIEQLQLIYNLVKVRGFTLEGAKNELKENRKKLEIINNLHKKLGQLKIDLENLKAEL